MSLRYDPDGALSASCRGQFPEPAQATFRRYQTGTVCKRNEKPGPGERYREFTHDSTPTRWAPPARLPMPNS